MKRHFSLPLISLIILLLSTESCGKDANSTTVVRINTDCITKETFDRIIPPADFSTLTKQQKIDRVISFSNSELLYYDAIKKHLDRDESIIQRLKDFTEENTIQIYLNHMILDSVVTEQLLHDSYEKLPLEYRQYHTFSSVKNELKDNAIKYFRSQLQQEYLNFLEELKFQNELLINEKDFNQLLSAFTDTLKFHQSINKPSTYIGIFKSIPINAVIATTKSKKYDKKWFVEKLAGNAEKIPPNIGAYETASYILETIIVSEIISDNARAAKIDQDEEFVNALYDFKHRIVLNLYRKREIENRIAVSEDSLLAFYNKYSSNYLSTPTAEVWEVFLKDKAKAERLLDLAASVKDFPAFAAKHTERLTFATNQKAYLGFINHDQYAGIGKKAQAVPENTVYNEVIPSGLGYSIIRVGKKNLAEPQPFEAVKGRVQNDFLADTKVKMETAIINRLKRKYSIKIYWNALDMEVTRDDVK
ncbi:MAG: peptidylprolyl isomerase [Candidatus Marinimicrobia bacterium]|nr:peptidylprolyl isomerase [Candidatus Neomarinimicrobiota bacterium]